MYTSLTSLRPHSSLIWLAQDCFEKVNDKVLLSLQIKETQLVYRNKKINNHTLQLPYIDSGQIKLKEMTAQRLVTLPKQAWMWALVYIGKYSMSFLWGLFCVTLKSNYSIDLLLKNTSIFFMNINFNAKSTYTQVKKKCLLVTAVWKGLLLQYKFKWLLQIKIHFIMGIETNLKQ